MKNQIHWNFNQRNSSKLMLLFGLASMAFSAICYLFQFTMGLELAIGIGWILLLGGMLIYHPEKVMIRIFED